MTSRKASERRLALTAFLATFAAFLPCLRDGFVGTWDDDSNFLLNPFYRGFTATNLRWMLTVVHNAHYHPLTWLSYALDYTLWGMNPAGYHMTSLLLHCANAAAFFFVALRLLGRDRPAAALFSALLFALHPLRVESAVWLSERRDVLSGLFYLLTILAYLKSLDFPDASPQRGRWFKLSLGVYALSLLSKAMGITLPAALLILDVYPLRRLPADPRRWNASPTRKILLEKIIFAVPAAAATVVGFMGEMANGAARPLSEYGALQRLAVACYGLAFYLWKTLLPFKLLPLYPMPPRLNPWTPAFVLSAAAVAALTAAFWLGRRRFPAGLACWAFYGATLFPVLGVAHFGPQIVADRYSYLACLPWALLAGAWLRREGLLRYGAAALAAVLLAALTWSQCFVWRSSGTLWGYTAAADPGHAIARNYLGNLALENGRLDEAVGWYQEAIKIDPDYGAARNNLGNALSRMGRLAEAEAQLRAVIRLHPDHQAVHYNLGAVLAAEGKRQEAAAAFAEELRINPYDQAAREALRRAADGKVIPIISPGK